MNLTRPLFVFDLETTGLDPAVDRIVQIAYTKVMTDGTFETKSRFINPTVPIPAEATAIHRITNARVDGEVKFHQIARSLHSLMQGCDIGGYNVAGFDIELLWEEFYRAGIEWDVSQHKVIDALAIWRAMMPRKLIDAVKEFRPELSSTIKEDLHDAEHDVFCTVKVMGQQFERWNVDLSDIDKADAMSKRTVKIAGEEMDTVDLAGVLARRSDGVIVFTHKKVRGVPVKNDRKYGGWIINNDGFGENTKIHLRAALS